MFGVVALALVVAEAVKVVVVMERSLSSVSNFHDMQVLCQL